MSRIEINAGGRHIIVDHTGDLPYLAEHALDLWTKAASDPPPPGPAVGFVAELAPQWNHDRQRPVRAQDGGTP